MLERSAKRIPAMLARSIPTGWISDSWTERVPGKRTLDFIQRYHNPTTSFETKVLRMVIGQETFINELLGDTYDPWYDLSTNCDLPKFDARGHGVQQMMQMDYLLYLPGDILTKVDRATMSVSLEGREPLLDYQLAELTFRMPMNWKIRGSERKRILKTVTEQHIPRSLLDRPKKGFSIPYAGWLRGKLKHLLDENLSQSSVMRHGILNPNQVDRICQRFLKGDATTNAPVWNILMFQMWCNRWL
jgi:hypothetical protein